MNNSHEYVKNVIRLYERHEDVWHLDVWREFERQSMAFTVVDWEESLKVARLYKATLKQCYVNCRIISAINRNYRYFEGFATAIIPIEHAWLVRRSDGVVIDPTFVLLPDDDGAGYDWFGVHVSNTDLRRKRRNIYEPGWIPQVVRRIPKERRPNRYGKQVTR